MGRTHTLLGATLGLSLATPLAAYGLHRTITLPELAAFTLATAGYSLLPDFDHPQATLARTLGPATRAVARLICKLSGGHRKGTHTIWFAALTIGLAAGLGAGYGRDAQLPMLFVGYFIALMILRLAPRQGSGTGELVYAVEAAGLTFATYHYVHTWWWLPGAVGLGTVWHILGDILTVEGVPVFYPLAKRFVVKFPILGHTDSMREHVFAFALIPVFIWVAVAAATGNHWWAYSWAEHPDTWDIALR